MSKTKRNSFTRKMEAKSTEELCDIVNNKDFVKEARTAAQWELETREEDGTLEMENQARMDSQLDENRYDDFVKTIKRKRSFTFFGTPSYAESLKNNLSVDAKFGIIIKALNKLKWEIVVTEENRIQAIRPSGTGGHSEQILIGFGPSNLLVKSKSLGSESMDFGRNSVRVKLFIHVFLEIVHELDEEDIAELEEKTRRERNWEDYEIPESLPTPPKFKAENLMVFFPGTALLGTILGSILGLIMSYAYLIFFAEIAISWVLGYLTARIAFFSNYSGTRLQATHLVTSALIILVAQVVSYLVFLNQEPNLIDIGLFHYIQLKIEAGFVLDNINLGIWGWVGVFLMQGIVLYYHGMLKLYNGLTRLQINSVPKEVIEYVIYLNHKDHSLNEMRNLLAEKGWNDQLAQDAVFRAVDANQGRLEMIKEN